MNYKLYILSIFTLLCISCSKEVTEEGVVVNFNTTIQPATKVDEYFLEGETIGVLGYNLQGGEVWNGTSSAPDFMYNSPLKYTGSGNWKTDKIYYWSQNPENRKRFYAYYPYSVSGTSDNLTISPINNSGSPYIDFTVTDAKTDFIVCDAQEGNVENPTVYFTARHALAKLTFSFASDVEHGMAYIKVQKINGLIKRGRFSFDAVSGNGFENGTEKMDLPLPQPTTGDIFINSNNPVNVEEYTLYILPPNNNDGKGGIGTLEAVINGNETLFDLSSVPVASGRNTNIKIVINQKEITFTATIEDWETGGNITDIID